MIKKLGVVFVGLVVFVLLAPMMLYWWGLSNLATEPVPSEIKLTSGQEQEIWSKEKEAGSPNLKSVTPYGCLLYFTCNAESGINSTECIESYPGIRLSTLAVRKQVGEQVAGKGNGVWQVTWLAYTIWVTQHWNIHQVLATYHEAYNT